MKRLFFWAILIFLAGCAARPTHIPAQMSSEAKVYTSRCILCHSLPHPKRHTYAQWEGIMAVMDERMEQKGMKPLASQEKSAIMRYLKKYAR